MRKHSTGSEHHMWAFAKINSLPQRTSVEKACMKKHRKHFAPHTYLMHYSQGQSKSSPYWRPLNHLQGSTTFTWCFVCLFHKHAILLEFQSLCRSDKLIVGCLQQCCSKNWEQGALCRQSSTGSEGEQAGSGNDDEVQH